MGETEKIMCFDRPSGIDTSALLAMNGGMGNNWNNNPFAYLIWIYAMRFLNGNGWGENGAENFNSRQIAALQDTVNSNHNNDIAIQAIQGNGKAIADLALSMNTSFANANQAVCGVRSAIEQVAGAVGYSAEKVINAANLGDLNIVQQLKDCCCSTQKEIIKQGYEGQIATMNQTTQLQERMTGIANGLQQGFSSTAYETQRQTCDIVNAIHADGQATRDLLNGHWALETSQALQDAKNEISQLKQTAAIGAMIKTNGCGC